MNTEIIKIYSSQDFKHKEYIKKMTIERLAIIHLLLDNNQTANQVLLTEVPAFLPSHLSYADIDIESLLFRDNRCKYMDYFQFAEGFFCGMEYDEQIKYKRLYLTKMDATKYCFWNEIDFEHFKKYATKEDLKQLTKIYNEWLSGNKILLKHLSANSTRALDLKNYEENIHLCLNQDNEKRLRKTYTGVLPSHINH